MTPLPRGGQMLKIMRFLVKILLPGYHIKRKPGPRKAKEPIKAYGGRYWEEEKSFKTHPSDSQGQINHEIDPISQEYRTSHLRGNFPGQNLGD